MGKWTDVAQWVGPTVNSGDGDGRPGEPEDRMSGHVGLVVHIAEGSFAGTVAWEKNSSAEVSSHFVTGKDGRVVQVVDTDDRSWCQSAGNSTWLSVENEGRHTDALTAGQVEALAKLLAKAHQVYGVPLQVTNSTGTPGLGWHGMGGSAWGGHTGCPGDRIKAQLPAIVARAAAICGQKPPAPKPASKPAPRPPAGPPRWPLPVGHVYGLVTGPEWMHGGYYASERPTVKAIQQRLIRAGAVPGITNPNSGWADGLYESPTANAVKRFQRARKLKVSGWVDAATWKVLMA